MNYQVFVVDRLIANTIEGTISQINVKDQNIYNTKCLAAI